MHDEFLSASPHASERSFFQGGLAATELPPAEGFICARYFVTQKDVADGAVSRMVQGIGYGLGQRGLTTGLEMFSCSTLLAHPQELVKVLRIEPVDETYSQVDIAIKQDVCDFSGLGFTGLMSFFLGDIFGGAYAGGGLVLDRIVLSEEIARVFPGPVFGGAEIVHQCSRSRYLLGLLLKPNLGAAAEYFAEVAAAAAAGGIDYIKEDELNLTSDDAPRLQRVAAIANSILKSGRKILYAANVTDQPTKLRDTAKAIKNCGASVFLVNGVITGLDAVASLALDKSLAIPIHLHRAGHDILCDGRRRLTVPCLSELCRLAGADLVHVGSPLGRLFTEEEIRSNCIRVTQPMYGKKESLPVLSRSSKDIFEYLQQQAGQAPSTGLILFDAEVYASPAGVEGAVKQLRRVLDATFQ